MSINKISKKKLSVKQLQSKIDKFARIKIAHTPTPLEEMPNLTKTLNGPKIWVKREDMTGLVYGGNKARHYEFEMPVIKNEGYAGTVDWWTFGILTYEMLAGIDPFSDDDPMLIY